MDKRIGFIGLGIMGTPMARNLIKAGFEVVVFNRTASKAERLAAEGAKRASAIKELADVCPIVITMVTNTPDVESIILGENGVINAIKAAVFFYNLNAGSAAIDFKSFSALSSCSGVPLTANQQAPSAPHTPPLPISSAVAPVKRAMASISVNTCPATGIKRNPTPPGALTLAARALRSP